MKRRRRRGVVVVVACSVLESAIPLRHSRGKWQPRVFCSQTCGRLEGQPATTLFHPHPDIESLAFQHRSDTTTLHDVEAFPSVEVGRCGFIQGLCCGALGWLLLLNVACLSS